MADHFGPNFRPDYAARLCALLPTVASETLAAGVEAYLADPGLDLKGTRQQLSRLARSVSSAVYWGQRMDTATKQWIEDNSEDTKGRKIIIDDILAQIAHLARACEISEVCFELKRDKRISNLHFLIRFLALNMTKAGFEAHARKASLLGEAVELTLRGLGEEPPKDMTREINSALSGKIVEYLNNFPRR